MSADTHSLKDRVKMATERVLRIVASPATVAHEATHALCSLPWSEGTAVVISPDTHVLIDWGDDSPRWAIFLAHIAPLILGALIAVATLTWMLVDPRRLPDSRGDWLWLALLGLYWGVYSLGTLSEGDRNLPGDDRSVSGGGRDEHN